MKQCPICGKHVPARAGKRDSVYCSRVCLQEHYAEAWETLTCPVCGKPFRARKVQHQRQVPRSHARKKNTLKS